MKRYKIRNISDLQHETSKVRKAISEGEQIITDDVVQVIDSVTPMRILAGITSKLLSSAPALYSAYTIFRSIFGRKK